VILRIAHVASEMAPFAKVGGLGDVVLGLCRELQRQGHAPITMLPLYGMLDRDCLAPLQLARRDGATTIWSSHYQGLPLFLVELEDLFQRPGIYGYHDDVQRFAQFARATWSFLQDQGVDLIHCHDWPTACLTRLAQGQLPTLLTLHNIDYQGACLPEQLGFDEPELDNCLRIGIHHASHITAVSPTYCQEIQTPLGGRGLDGHLRERADRLSPVLNGIDTTYWNPSTDPLLPVRLGNDPSAFKRANKQSLHFDPTRPLVGMVARLVPQKGVELIPAAIEETLSQGGQFALLGTSPIPTIQDEFEALAQQYAGHPEVRLHLCHDEATAHQIFAASDLFLVPSLFEPCGLTQLIALHYGALPLVRRTGGLADTVFDVEHESPTDSKGNGFVFEEPTEQALCATIRRALHRWHTTPSDWSLWVQRALQLDVSWQRPAAAYAQLYERLVSNLRT
jgi:starch synthase